MSPKADFDLETIAGLTGSSLHFSLLNRHGTSGSLRNLGDTVESTQEIYGGTDGSTVHLAYAFGEVSFGDDKFDIALGRLPVANDFAISLLYCDFLTTLSCTPHGVIGDVGYNFYPNSTWGGRLRFSPNEKTYILGGVYQVRPELGGALNRAGFAGG